MNEKKEKEIKGGKRDRDVERYDEMDAAPSPDSTRALTVAHPHSRTPYNPLLRVSNGLLAE